MSSSGESEVSYENEPSEYFKYVCFKVKTVPERLLGIQERTKIQKYLDENSTKLIPTQVLKLNDVVKVSISQESLLKQGE